MKAIENNTFLGVLTRRHKDTYPVRVSGLSPTVIPRDHHYAHNITTLKPINQSYQTHKPSIQTKYNYPKLQEEFSNSIIVSKKYNLESTYTLVKSSPNQNILRRKKESKYNYNHHQVWCLITRMSLSFLLGILSRIL